MTSFNELYQKHQDNTLSEVEMRELLFQCGFYGVTSACKTGYQLFDNNDEVCFDGKIFPSYPDILSAITLYIKTKAKMVA